MSPPGPCSAASRSLLPTGSQLQAAFLLCYLSAALGPGDSLQAPSPRKPDSGRRCPSILGPQRRRRRREKARPPWRSPSRFCPGKPASVPRDSKPGALYRELSGRLTCQRLFGAELLEGKIGKCFSAREKAETGPLRSAFGRWRAGGRGGGETPVIFLPSRSGNLSAKISRSAASFSSEKPANLSRFQESRESLRCLPDSENRKGPLQPFGKISWLFCTHTGTRPLGQLPAGRAEKSQGFWGFGCSRPDSLFAPALPFFFTPFSKRKKDETGQPATDSAS